MMNFRAKYKEKANYINTEHTPIEWIFPMDSLPHNSLIKHYLLIYLVISHTFSVFQVNTVVQNMFSNYDIMASYIKLTFDNRPQKS